MNKQEFIKWVNSLSYDFEVEPIQMSEFEEHSSDWVGQFTNAHQKPYSKVVTTKMKLDVCFTGIVSADFKRDKFGNELWSNVDYIK